MRKWIHLLNFFGISFIGIGIIQFLMRMLDYKIEMKVKKKKKLNFKGN
jgi:hypothetical protein